HPGTGPGRNGGYHWHHAESHPVSGHPEGPAGHLCFPHPAHVWHRRGRHHGYIHHVRQQRRAHRHFYGVQRCQRRGRGRYDGRRRCPHDRAAEHGREQDHQLGRTWGGHVGCAEVRPGRCGG